MKKLLIILYLFAMTAHADTASTLSRYKGYTIVDVLTIEGWIDKNGKRESSFNGCEYGRVIIFSGNKSLRCSSYGYQYAYRPEAVIISRGGSYTMIVESDSYDMSN